MKKCVSKLIQAMLLPVCSVLFFCDIVAAQELGKGDVFPIKLAGAEGKQLVILDFWNTTCKGCIKSFPKLDSLQEKYKDKVAIYLVSKEAKDYAERFFALRKKTILKPRVNYIYSDVALKKYFPHKAVPHVVWLDGKGKVLGITDGRNLDDNNIRDYLEDGRLELEQQRRDLPYDGTRFLHGEPGDSSLLYHSFLRYAIDSLNGTVKTLRTNTNQAYRYIGNKRSVLELLYDAFGEGRDKFSYYYKNVIFEVNDSMQYKRPDDPAIYREWAPRNLYLYDLVISPAMAPQIYKFMQQDINRLFSLNARVEKRERICYALRMGGEDKIATKGGPWLNQLRKPPADSLWVFQNMAFKDFFKLIESRFHVRGLKLIDETGYDKFVDITISGEITDGIDIEAIRKDLRKYNLVLEEVKCMVDILVIREK